MATASVVLGFGFLYLPGITGLVGAPLAVLAKRAIKAQPQQWRGDERASLGLGLCLLFGVVPAAVLTAVKMDDWGPIPLVACLLYAGVLVALGFTSKSTPGGVAAGAAAGIGGVGLIAIIAVGLTLAVVFLFQTIFTEFADAIYDAACSNSNGNP